MTTMQTIISAEYNALNRLLLDWADWQASYRPKNGFPSHSFGFASGGLKDFDDLSHQCDSATMRAIDAAIGSLVPAQAAAINRCYGVCAVFRFPRLNYDEVLEQAHESLIVIVKRRGVVL